MREKEKKVQKVENKWLMNSIKKVKRKIKKEKRCLFGAPKRSRKMQ